MAWVLRVSQEMLEPRAPLDHQGSRDLKDNQDQTVLWELPALQVPQGLLVNRDLPGHKALQDLQGLTVQPVLKDK